MLYVRVQTLIAIYITVFVFVACSEKSSLLCKDIVSKSVDLALKNYLLCDYDTSVRPSVNRDNATVVSFAIIPKFIEFDDTTSTFDVHAWTIIGWTDAHLKWEPAKFNSTKQIHVNTDEIWTPDISVHNSGDLSKDQNEIPLTKCELRYNGAIVCVASNSYTVHCDADYTMYPYDTQNCTIQLASWSHTGMEITFKLIRKGIMMDDYRPNWQWKLVSSGTNYQTHVYKFKFKDNSPMITIYFLLERQPDSLHSIYVTPIFVLILLTLTSLWLDARSTERTTVACINFICHLLAMINFHWNLPFNGSAAPHLLLFYECSFIMAAMCLILSVALCEMYELKCAPPNFITNTTFFILRSRVGQILLLSILDPKASASLDLEADDNVDIINQQESKHNIWEHVATLISWLFFIVISFVYVIMLGLYLPRKTF